MDQLLVGWSDRRKYAAKLHAIFAVDEVVGAKAYAAVVLAYFVAFAIEVTLTYELAFVKTLQNPGRTVERIERRIDRCRPLVARKIVTDLYAARAPRQL